MQRQGGANSLGSQGSQARLWGLYRGLWGPTTFPGTQAAAGEVQAGWWHHAPPQHRCREHRASAGGRARAAASAASLPLGSAWAARRGPAAESFHGREPLGATRAVRAWHCAGHRGGGYANSRAGGGGGARRRQREEARARGGGRSGAEDPGQRTAAYASSDPSLSVASSCARGESARPGSSEVA